MKHIIMKSSGESSIYESENLDSLTLNECNKLIGGWIEVYPLPREENTTLPSNSVLIIDEEGLIKGLPINVFAAWRTNRIIVGDIVISKSGIKDGEGGELIGFTDEECEKVMSLIKNFETMTGMGSTNGKE